MKNRLCAAARCLATSAMCGSSSMISWIWAGRLRSPAMIRVPSAIDRSRTRPRASGQHREPDRHVGQRLGRGHRDLRPRVQVDTAVALPGDRRAHHVDQADDLAALALDLPDRERRVRRLPGLAHRHVQRVRLDDRVPVAELRRRLRVRRDARQLLDHRRADLPHVVGRPAAQDLHPPEAAQLARGQVQPVQPRRAEPLVQPAPQHPLDGRRLLQDLLVHVVPVAVGVRVEDVQVDAGRRLAGVLLLAAERPELRAGHHGQLAVVQVDHRRRVPHQRRQVTGQEHLPVADAQDERGPVAGRHHAGPGAAGP